MCEAVTWGKLGQPPERGEGHGLPLGHEVR